jgi:glyoxylase-like metal-dependent hydrolase (beta-lactamase superfamily II)
MSVQPKMVVPGVQMLPFEIGQVYIWDWGEGLTVVDSGIAGSADAILEAVAAIGRAPDDVKEIVLTHYHDDHRGGAAELRSRTGARVVAHRTEAPVIRGQRPQLPPNLTELERPIAEGVIARMLPPQAGNANRGPETLEALASKLVVSTLLPVEVQREVEDGDMVAGGGLVVHGPGHTPGSIGLLVPALGVLFTGDTLATFEGNVIPGVFNVDGDEMLRSIRKLARLDFDAACFGHGAPVVEGASRQVRALAETLH